MEITLSSLQKRSDIEALFDGQVVKLEHYIRHMVDEYNTSDGPGRPPLASQILRFTFATR